MIDRFETDNRFLSNFWNCNVFYAGVNYLNTESAYQAAKFNDPEIRTKFWNTNGGAAKQLGTTYRSSIRKDWKEVNLGIMAEIVHAKFTQNKDLRNKLLLTYPQEIIEGNPFHDQFWGICTCPQHAGFGLNWLGRILMAERVYWLDLTVNNTHYNGDRLMKLYEEKHGLQHNCPNSERCAA